MVKLLLRHEEEDDDEFRRPVSPSLSPLRKRRFLASAALVASLLGMYARVYQGNLRMLLPALELAISTATTNTTNTTRGEAVTTSSRRASTIRIHSHTDGLQEMPDRVQEVPPSQIQEQQRPSNNKHYPTSAGHYNLLQAPLHNYLNDQTIRLSPHVHRPWLAYHEYQGSSSHKGGPPPPRPRRKLVITDFGWNHVNRAYSLTAHPRGIRAREILQAWIDHADFDPTFSWSTVMEQLQLQQSQQNEASFKNNTQYQDMDVQHLVLMDVETCFEHNYPLYGGSWDDNYDFEAGRTGVRVHGEMLMQCYGANGCSGYMRRVLNSPLFGAREGEDNSNVVEPINTNLLVYIDCEGDGPELNFRQKYITHPQLVMAAESTHYAQVLPIPHYYQRYNASYHNDTTVMVAAKKVSYDMGLPPPAVNPIRLSLAQQRAILEQDCGAASHDKFHRPGTSNHRRRRRRMSHNMTNYTTVVRNSSTSPPDSYFLSFVGNNRDPARQGLMDMDNLTLGVLARFPHQVQDDPLLQNETYVTILQKSIFAAVPRGDNLFSYRFTEVLSSGSIPVVYADGWVLPFRPELVDWPKECAVVIPQAKVADTLSILHKIPVQEQCRRRKRCYELYLKYMVNPEGTIAGILDSLDRVSGYEDS